MVARNADTYIHIYTIRTRTRLGDRSFSVVGPCLWTSLHYLTESSHLHSLRDFGLCRAAAHSDCCFFAPCTNILTYLLTYYRAIYSPAFCRSLGTVVWSLCGDVAIDRAQCRLAPFPALPIWPRPLGRRPTRCLALPHASGDVDQPAAEAVATATDTAAADRPLRRRWCMSDQAATDAGVPAGRPTDWQTSTVVVEAGAGAPGEGRSFVVWTAKRSICRRWFSSVCWWRQARRGRSVAVCCHWSSLLMFHANRWCSSLDSRLRHITINTTYNDRIIQAPRLYRPLAEQNHVGLLLPNLSILTYFLIYTSFCLLIFYQLFSILLINRKAKLIAEFICECSRENMTAIIHSCNGREWKFRTAAS